MYALPNANLSQSTPQPPEVPHTPYNAPKTYSIGQHPTVAPLVPLKNLRSHLRLLKAFRELRDRVELSAQDGETKIKFEGTDAASTEAVVKAADGKTKWTWIVGLAVERFVVDLLRTSKSLISVHQVRTLVESRAAPEISFGQVGD